MNKELIDRVAAELNSTLAETRLRSITQIGKFRYIVTFEAELFRRLLISIDPRDPRLYLIRRRDRDIKRLSAHRSLFAIAAERTLAGMLLVSAATIPGERAVELTFGTENLVRLIIQLTGISSNLFVVDEENSITVADRSSAFPGQSVGTIYFPPAEHPRASGTLPGPTIPTNDQSISEALDAYFSTKDSEAEFRNLVDSARAKNQQQIRKAEKLIANLENDLIEHGDAEKWKRFGDLLLASPRNANRPHGSVEVIDIFDEDQPSITIEADDNDTIPETAQKYFRRYTKARNAKDEVQARIEKTTLEIERLRKVESEIENAIEQNDTEYFRGSSVVGRQTTTSKPRTKEEKQLSGIRTYTSSDGFEILVGKKSTDNDFLTQRVAHSRDTWMHAADYPGSHVVIRNANRKEIPHSTLIEAAQLAAFFSQGNKQIKAAVNYAEKKFVSKPKGAAPGLVRLSSFKTLLVEPVFPKVEKKG